MYQVFLHPHAEKELNNILSSDFPKIDAAIRGLGLDPRPHGIKKLDENLFRIRMGDWRIIYSIFDAERRVAILRIARRNERTYS